MTVEILKKCLSNDSKDHRRCREGLLRYVSSSIAKSAIIIRATKVKADNEVPGDARSSNHSRRSLHR